MRANNTMNIFGYTDTQIYTLYIYIKYRHRDTDTDTDTDSDPPASVVQTVGVVFVIIQHRELNNAAFPLHPLCLILLVLVSNLFNWLMIRDGQALDGLTMVGA